MYNKFTLRSRESTRGFMWKSWCN